MNYRIEQQQQPSDVIIVGVSRHQQAVPKWAEFVAAQQVPLDAWIKSGDIQLSTGALTVIPVASGRILFVGLDHRKKISAAELTAMFEAVGALMHERKWRSASMMLETFYMPQFTALEIAEHALAAIRYGSYHVYGYQTFSNEADVSVDELIFITDNALDLTETHRASEQLAVWRAYAHEPVNVLTAARIEEHVVAYCAAQQLACHVLRYEDAAELGFGALCAAYEQDVRIVLVNATLYAQHTVVGAFAVGETMPLWNALDAVVATHSMAVFAFGTLKTLPAQHVITTMSGKTLELRDGALARDVALVDVLAFATTQRVLSITSVSPLSAEGKVVFGADGCMAYTTSEAPAVDLVIQARAPKPSALADAVVENRTEGRVVARAALYRLFAPARWVHLELPASARQQQSLLGQWLRNLVKED